MGKHQIVRRLVLSAVLVLGGTVTAEAQVSFTSQDFPTGMGPVFVTAADFNHDGKMDVAVANRDDSTISIFLGLGSGNLGSRKDFPTGSKPNSIAVGDFNGDGILDLAVVNSGSDTISILLGIGDGTFGPPQDFSVGGKPWSVVCGDYNGDGRLDLAIGNRNSDSISVLLGSGTGTFGLRQDFPAGIDPVQVVTGDFDGDGKLDLATANQHSNSVSVLLGNGDGTFQAKKDFPVGKIPAAILAADFSLDRKQDLATANSAASTASILLGTGTGTFNSATDLGTDTNPISLTAADFDGDGKIDLVSANYGVNFFYFGIPYFSSNISLFLGLGDGTFSTKTNYWVIAEKPAWITSVDFDGDGKPDLVSVSAGNNLLTITLQAPELVMTGIPAPFSTVTVSTTSAPKTLMLRSGTLPVLISSIIISGANAGDFHTGTDTCSGMSLAPDTSCTSQIVFEPLASGLRDATLVISSNAAFSPALIPIEGRGSNPGADFAIAVPQGLPNTATINAGESASFSLLFQPINGFADNVSLTCQGPAVLIGCIATPSDFALNGTNSVAVSLVVLTFARSTIPPLNGPTNQPIGPRWPIVLMLALLVIVVSATQRPQRTLPHARLVLAYSLAAIVFTISCGGGEITRTVPTSRATGTSAGTFVITVNASSPLVSKSTTFTVTVR